MFYAEGHGRNWPRPVRSGPLELFFLKYFWKCVMTFVAPETTKYINSAQGWFSNWPRRYCALASALSGSRTGTLVCFCPAIASGGACGVMRRWKFFFRRWKRSATLPWIRWGGACSSNIYVEANIVGWNIMSSFLSPQSRSQFQSPELLYMHFSPLAFVWFL